MESNGSPWMDVLYLLLRATVKRFTDSDFLIKRHQWASLIKYYVIKINDSRIVSLARLGDNFIFVHIIHLIAFFFYFLHFSNRITSILCTTISLTISIQAHFKYFCLNIYQIILLENKNSLGKFWETLERSITEFIWVRAFFKEISLAGIFGLRAASLCIYLEVTHQWSKL